MQIVYFTGPNCTYCKVALPSVMSYAQRKGASVVTVNADKETNKDSEKALVAEYGVWGVPVMAIIMPGVTQEPTVLRDYHDIMRFTRNED